MSDAGPKNSSRERRIADVREHLFDQLVEVAVEPLDGARSLLFLGLGLFGVGLLALGVFVLAFVFEELPRLRHERIDLRKPFGSALRRHHSSPLPANSRRRASQRPIAGVHCSSPRDPSVAARAYTIFHGIRVDYSVSDLRFQ